MKNGLLHLTFIASNDSENQANIGTPSAVDGATKDFIHSNYLEHCFLVINSNFSLGSIMLQVAALVPGVA